MYPKQTGLEIMTDTDQKRDSRIDSSVAALATALDDVGMSVEELFIEMTPEERLMSFVGSRAFDRIIEHAADAHLDTFPGYELGHENELSEGIYVRAIDQFEDTFDVSMDELSDDDYSKISDAIYERTDRMATRIIRYMEAGVRIGSPQENYFPTRTGVANFHGMNASDDDDDDDDDGEGEAPLIA